MSQKNPNRSVERSVAVPQSSIEVLPFDIRRTAVTFSTQTANIHVSKLNPATASSGLQIVAGTVPFTLCQCHGGDWVKGPLYGFADGANAFLNIVEGFEPAGAGEYDYGQSE